MLLRAQVNSKIAPACLENVQRLESTPMYAFLGRWGTFRFDVVLPHSRVERRPLPELALEVIALCNDAVQNAIASLVDDRFEQLLEARILEQLRELEAAQLENAAALRELQERPRWIRAVQRFARRVRREIWLAIHRP
jgi:hypothetical protein